MKLFILGILLVISFRSFSIDKLFINGSIWTGVEQQSNASVLAIDGGKIVYVGDTVPNHITIDQIIDLQGKFVMHGFIDNHVHFMEGGAALDGVDLRNASSPEEFSNRIIAYSKGLLPGRWVLNGNWDHQNWGGELPHKKWIDKDTSEIPVYVIRIDGHQALANTAALKLANINRETPDPAGGKIVRDENGEATGILKGNALNLLLSVIPPPSDAELMKQFSLAQELALSLGLSKVHAVTAYPTEITMLRTFMLAQKRGLMKIRAKVSTPIESWQDAAKIVSANGYGNEFLSYGGVKGFIDGSLGARTAWFHEEYADEKNYFGLPLNDPEIFGKWMDEADRAGLELSIHALGDRGIDTILAKFQDIAKGNIRDKRYRIEHFQHPTKAAIKVLANNHIIASMQPYHAIDDGRWAEQRLGDKRLSTAYAFRSILDAGGLLTFGSDWPVAPLSPIQGVYAAVTRSTTDNVNPNGWVPEQKITVEEALTAYTKTNSYAFGTEKISGTLEKGKLADFVVLSEDLRRVDPKKIKDIMVLENYINGHLVYKNATN